MTDDYVVRDDEIDLIHELDLIHAQLRNDGGHSPPFTTNTDANTVPVNLPKTQRGPHSVMPPRIKSGSSLSVSPLEVEE